MYEELLKELEECSKELHNFVGGKWVSAKETSILIDPMTGGPLYKYPNTSVDELEPFAEDIKSCPKGGLHNQFKNPERYRMLGEVSLKVGQVLSDPKMAAFMAQSIKSVMPKSLIQCVSENTVTKNFCEMYGPNNVRMLGCGRTTPGDIVGQQAEDYPRPLGSGILETPHNFPEEIFGLQIMGGLFMGNRILAKPSSLVGVVAEQFVRILLYCGLPKTDVTLIHCRGEVMETLIQRVKKYIRITQFTGSSEIAEKLAVVTHGKVRIEDAGFDWKILGRDYVKHDLDYVAWQCDQDAYAASGQKCSAQSILFMHRNWKKDLLPKLEELASKRNLGDLTVGPVLTWTTDRMLEHVEKLTAISGAHILFGGKPLTGHTIPACYGAIEPTAVFVPIKKISDPKYFDLVTTEVFGPVQVITEWRDDQLPNILDICERMENHLTAAVVSRDQEFIDTILGSAVNGTLYVGPRAKCTGAPEWHPFGPSNDPRAANLGPRESIIRTWSTWQTVIRNNGAINYSVDKLVQS